MNGLAKGELTSLQKVGHLNEKLASPIVSAKNEKQGVKVHLKPDHLGSQGKLLKHYGF